MNSLATQSLFGLAIAALIVFRVARRELNERTVRLRSLWIRPAIMVAIAAYITSLSVRLDPSGNGELLASLAGGAVLGIVTGWAIGLSTRYEPAAEPQAVLMRGSMVSFAIWIAAFGIRLLARYVLPHGADPRAQLPLNCGTIVMTAVAFIVIALFTAVEIRRYASSSAVPVSSGPGTITRQ